MEDIKEKELEEVSGGARPRARKSKYLVVIYRRKEFGYEELRSDIKWNDEIQTMGNWQYAQKWCEDRHFTYVGFEEAYK